ncbi:MAG: T9SS type A sorting domain-containing protein [Flavobacteriales bacterium]|nr:T9SS type A sorting domain-containing protein [Flavobacteriales bacterium]
MKAFLPLLLVCSSFGLQAQWTQRPSGTTQGLQAVQFPEPSSGFAVGYYGTVIRSVDAGLSWAAVDAPSSGDLRSLYFSDALHGFVAGDSGLYRTADGGNSWSTVATPVERPWRCVTFATPLVGFCAGGDYGYGVLLRTDDGGDSWAAVDLDPANPLSKVYFPTAEVGYATFYGYDWTVLKTTDGGLNWNGLPIQPIEGYSNLEGLCFQDADTGYAGGWYLQAFIRTTDGGATWTEVSPAFNVYSIALHGALNGIAVGGLGIIRHRTNGTDWVDETWGDITEVLYSVTYASEGVAVAVGENGLVLRWTAEGTGLAPVAERAASITLGPNPATDFLELHSTSALPPAAQLELLDALGRVVQRSAVHGQAPIDVSGLQAGHYTWRCISTDGAVAQGTVVIE